MREERIRDRPFVLRLNIVIAVMCCFGCYFQNSALRSYPTVNKLRSAGLGSSFRHITCSHPGLQREEKDSTQHRTSHHAKSKFVTGGKFFLFSVTLRSKRKEQFYMIIHWYNFGT